MDTPEYTLHYAGREFALTVKLTDIYKNGVSWAGRITPVGGEKPIKIGVGGGGRAGAGSRGQWRNAVLDRC